MHTSHKKFIHILIIYNTFVPAILDILERGKFGRIILLCKASQWQQDWKFEHKTLLNIIEINTTHLQIPLNGCATGTTVADVDTEQQAMNLI